MKLVYTIAGTLLAAGLAVIARDANDVEPLLREVPPGVFVDRSLEVPPAQTKAIGQKLGGEIQRLTNSIIRVHGRMIQVNVITAEDGEMPIVYLSMPKIESAEAD
jgi:hypothetical protein